MWQALQPCGAAGPAPRPPVLLPGALPAQEPGGRNPALAQKRGHLPSERCGNPLVPRTPPGTSPVPPGVAPLVLVLSGLSVRDLQHQGPRAHLAQGEVAMVVAVAVVAVAVVVVAMVAVAMAEVAMVAAAPPSGLPGPTAPGWAAAERRGRVACAPQALVLLRCPRRAEGEQIGADT